MDTDMKGNITSWEDDEKERGMDTIGILAGEQVDLLLEDTNFTKKKISIIKVILSTTFSSAVSKLQSPCDHRYLHQTFKHKYAQVDSVVATHPGTQPCYHYAIDVIDVVGFYGFLLSTQARCGRFFFTFFSHLFFFNDFFLHLTCCESHDDTSRWG